MTGRNESSGARRTLHRFGLCASLLILAGCVSGEAGGTAEVHHQLRVGVLPDESPEALRARHAPLLRYLSGELQLPCTLVIPKDYADLVRLFENGELDLAFLGGYTFVLVEARTGAIPIIMRDVDTRATSYFLVRTDDRRESIREFGNARFAFGSELSTSGHVMPRYFLRQEGIEPKEFFAEVRYAGAHDETAYLVRDKEVDIGVANSAVIDDMFEQGRLNRKDIWILWQTPTYANYVWTVPRTFPDEQRRRMVEAFLALSPATKGHAEILKHQQAGGFLPVIEDDFSRLRQIAAQVEMRSARIR